MRGNCYYSKQKAQEQDCRVSTCFGIFDLYAEEKSTFLFNIPIHVAADSLSDTHWSDM